MKYNLFLEANLLTSHNRNTLKVLLNQDFRNDTWTNLNVEFPLVIRAIVRSVKFGLLDEAGLDNPGIIRVICVTLGEYNFK